MIKPPVKVVNIAGCLYIQDFTCWMHKMPPLNEDDIDQIAAALNQQGEVAELIEAAEFMLEGVGESYPHSSQSTNEAYKKHAATIAKWRDKVRGFQADETTKKGQSHDG